MALLLGACQSGPAPTPTRAPTATPYVIVVTRTPTPSPTLTPLPSAMKDIFGYSWQVYAQYTLSEDPDYGTIKFTGSGPLTIAPSGEITGQIALRATQDYPLCATRLPNAKSQTAKIVGKLRAVSDTLVTAELRLIPDDPLQETTLWLKCGDAPEITRSDPLLWPILASTNSLKLEFPFRAGTSTDYARDLSGPMEGHLHGS
ncbi:MAG TPA: hypothetical protein VMT34_14670, partial [Aggregatilineales bacterium]|nr:hypothetical protein [Aggregatilineales bacterium]